MQYNLRATYKGASMVVLTAGAQQVAVALGLRMIENDETGNVVSWTIEPATGTVSGPLNYLVCGECGEAFDGIETATAHEFQQHSKMLLSDLEHPEYKILSESEAF